MTARSVLVAGLPRSGSTWVANALGRTEGASYVHEPDNDRHHVHAMAAKAGRGRHPLLGPGDRADAYARLFQAAFGDAEPGAVAARRAELARRLAGAAPAGALDAAMGDRPGPWPWALWAARLVVPPPAVGPRPDGTRVVKSVHCALALDWLLDRLRPDAGLVLVRHPANVVGSWRDLGWDLLRFPWSDPRLWERHGPPEQNPGPGRPGSLVERGAWQFSLLANALLAAAERHDLPVVDHEDVLADPVPVLAGVAGRLGLRWTPEAEAWVTENDRPGEGYELQRVAAEQRGRWRSRLAPSEAAVLAEVVGRFPRLRDRWPLS